LRRGERTTVVALLAGLVAIAALVLGGTRWVLRPYLVAGVSMEPTLAPGDRVLVSLRAYRDRPPSTGDVVLVRLDDGAELVKRVVRVTGSREAGGWVWVTGDNRVASLDSRRLGPIDLRQVVGRVAFRYAPLGRAGPIE
jgi:signal peptidase I